MEITVLAGGVGGARFVRGLLHHLRSGPPATDPSPPAHRVRVIGNTGDDISLFGLRVCPDLDTLMYTLGGGVHEDQGWGRADESFAVQGELAAYGSLPQWFGLGDRDFGTHIARTQWLSQGSTLSQVTERLSRRWRLPEQGVDLLPMTDVPVETHVVVELEGEERAIHFQEWWVRHRAQLPAKRFVVAGLDRASAAPGVLDALRGADVILLPPSNPVVSIGIILGVPGVRDALRGSSAPVVGVSPLIDGAPVRGHADACLAAIGVESQAGAVAGLYADFLDGWLVAPQDESATRAAVGTRAGAPQVRGVPLLMSDVEAAAELAGEALALATTLRR